MTNEDQLPPPEMVLQAARDEAPQRILDDYTAAIHELREKNFTFREIAEWLGKFGFNVDHNAVWRAYAKTVPDYQAHLAAEADEKLENEEAYREALVNGEVTTVISTGENPAEPAAISKDAEPTPKQNKKGKPSKKGGRK